MNKNLHIITLNIPFPPDYGGMIDSYYRIKSLHDIGVDIHLHCFEYGRSHSPELELICKKVYYYPRKKGLIKQFSLRPFIVNSRRSDSLLNNLLKNDYPILFDGLHTTYYVSHHALAERKKLIRLHNVEHKYYQTLSRHERNLIKKLYFHIESYRLKRFEKVLRYANLILPISGLEQEYFNNEYNNSVFMGPFHPFRQTEIHAGSGDYILYHGDLSVNENAEISEILISKVFSLISYPCIVAGKNPPESLKKMISNHPNISVLSDPDYENMMRLIRNAQIHVLPALESNGIKIKLLFALFVGRHCLVNSVVTKGSNLGELCIVADTWEEMKDKIHFFMKQPFTQEMVQQRKRLLSEHYNNDTNAKMLIDLIFNDQVSFRKKS